ncbi:hypothetical protein [Variovorax sp. KK3]|uniref:hypothetical protein n=1 Tax=Variovorax sp. KK3 TaxID=1855728 RepID=UPI00097C1E04|nr:hypothetical protein [Variovorax sp. KK3]
MTSAGKSLVDAFHAELLVEVQELSANVEALKAQVPAITADIQASADGVRSSAKQTLTDFEAMGLALTNVLRRRVADEHAEAARVHAEISQHTERALQGLTRHLWLLIGLAGANVLLLAAILVGQHF